MLHVTEIAVASFLGVPSALQFTIPEDLFPRLQPYTMINLLKLALRLEWPALIRFIDTKAGRFIFISLDHGDEPYL
jgi:hypothetical protein